jgi:hypothetical protein
MADVEDTSSKTIAAGALQNLAKGNDENKVRQYCPRGVVVTILDFARHAFERRLRDTCFHPL